MERCRIQKAQRYDWSKATLKATNTPLPIGFQSQYQEQGYKFVIMVPVAKDRAKPRFSVLVFFKQLVNKPKRDDVGNVIERSLRDKSLKQATIQRAAARLMDSLRDAYPGSMPLSDIEDLTIVEIDHVDATR